MQSPNPVLTNLQLEVGHRSHVGRVREINEDSYLMLTPPAIQAPIDALILVADGVGGANAGEVASGMLVELFVQWFASNTYAQHVQYSASHDDYFIAVLKDLMEIANGQLHSRANSDASLSRMGTTATIGLLSKNQLFIGHVGDTRLYLLRQGELKRLTADHSWVAEQVRLGKLTPAEAENHPRSNVVNRVLGTESVVRVDRSVHILEPDDVLLAASDGLTGPVRDHEIVNVIYGSTNVQHVCDQLVELANQRGGSDNVTVLCAHVTARAQSVPTGSRVNSVYLNQMAHPPMSSTPVPRPVTDILTIDEPDNDSPEQDDDQSVWLLAQSGLSLVAIGLVCVLAGLTISRSHGIDAPFVSVYLPIFGIGFLSLIFGVLFEKNRP